MTINRNDKVLVDAGVLFLPWVGKRYEYGFEGVRLLVLGESQYDGVKRDQSIADSSTTRAGIRWFMDAATKFRFATNTQHLVNCRPIQASERSSFWHSVAFYNYVQAFVGKAARVRPDKSMWRASRDPFLAALRALDPQAVLVLGFGTWGHLLDFPLGPTLPDREGLDDCPSRLFPTGSRQALAFHTMHPSAAISPPQWYERVAAGLQLAGKDAKIR